MLLIRINEDINSPCPRVDRIRTFDNLRSLLTQRFKILDNGYDLIFVCCSFAEYYQYYNLRLKWFLDSRKCIVLVESLKEYFRTSSLEEFIKSV